MTIAAGRIVAVGSPPDGVPVEDLGNVALIPGLVNAHTHLEFSDLAGPIGRPGIGMADWLRSVMKSRGTARLGGVSPVVQGLAESVRHGMTTIGEIAQPEYFTYLLHRTALRGDALLGIDRSESRTGGGGPGHSGGTCKMRDSPLPLRVGQSGSGV